MMRWSAEDEAVESGTEEEHKKKMSFVWRMEKEVGDVIKDESAKRSGGR